MKCQHCGKNEVTFVYRSSINGRTEEQRLCGECAEKLGFTRGLLEGPGAMAQRLFGGGLWGDFFSPTLPASLLGLRGMMESPFDDFFEAMPALTAASPEAEGTEKKPQELLSREEHSRFAALRQLNALRMEQKKAIHREDFEEAARLRDEIRKLEQARKEPRPSGSETA